MMVTCTQCRNFVSDILVQDTVPSHISIEEEARFYVLPLHDSINNWKVVNDKLA